MRGSATCFKSCLFILDKLMPVMKKNELIHSRHAVENHISAGVQNSIIVTGML